MFDPPGTLLEDALTWIFPETANRPSKSVKRDALTCINIGEPLLADRRNGSES